MYNKVVLIGRLTKEGETRFLNNGSEVYKNSIATSHKYKKQDGSTAEEICYLDFTCFGGIANICKTYLRKGSKILVEGRLNFEQWVDQNGQKRSKHSVVVETMQMLDSKGDAPNGYNAPQVDNDYDAPQYIPQQAQPQSYQQPSYSAPQQQSYQQQGYQPQQQPMQNRQMPQSNSIPVIDIDEDEIPF